MADLRSGKLDAVVGPLPADPELARGDALSLPYAEQSLGMISEAGVPSPLEMLTPLADRRLLILFAVLLGSALIVGTILWSVERHHEDDHFPDSPGGGVLRGMWFSLMTVTTVGYGDVTIKTSLGRFIAAGLLIATIVFQAIFTATLTSVLTLSKIGMGPANRPEALEGRTIGVVGGGDAEPIIERYGAKVKSYTDLKAAMSGLNNGEISGVVGPLLELELLHQNRKDDELKVVDFHVPLRHLHFGLSSDLQEQLNAIIVSVRNEGYVRSRHSKLLASAGSDSSSD
jgi:ABC-type amino acid transport substrate-binding protein